MKLIDVRKMLKNEIEQDKLNVASQSFNGEINLSFWGYTQANMTEHSNYELYFVPMVNGVTHYDILETIRKTSYGFYHKTSNGDYFVVDLYKVPKDCYFLDLFGNIYDYEVQETTVLDFTTKKGKIGFYDYECKKSGTFFLGRFARLEDDFWKFHPMYMQTNTISAIKRSYMNGDFLRKNCIA